MPVPKQIANAAHHFDKTRASSTRAAKISLPRNGSGVHVRTPIIFCGSRDILYGREPQC